MKIWVLCIWLTCGKHLHGCTISLQGEICAHKLSLTPPLFIEVVVSSQEGKQSCVCVNGIHFTFSTIFLLDFGIIPTGFCFNYSIYNKLMI